jgi:hypothetical protein
LRFGGFEVLILFLNFFLENCTLYDYLEEWKALRNETTSVEFNLQFAVQLQIKQILFAKETF